MPRAKIEILYFAALREQAGMAAETVRTAGATAAEVYAEARARHGLDMSPDDVGFAINDRYVEPGAPVTDGDRLAFIPPVCGG